jgi:hypothetical protein
MTSRDIISGDVSSPASTAGRKRIAVIGIDRYRSWPTLSNAVSDARGALHLFEQLGFQPVGEPLFDDAATGAAIRSFVTDELMALDPDDSLVLFFSGHGGTRSHWLGGEQVKTGYLIPVDAACGGDKVATWIDLDDWLRRIARLPPRHILVFVDACFAGIALSPIAKWRDSGQFLEVPLAALHGRRSRRIITSALDNQVALDNGPVSGHSLFTGCLIEGFTQGRLGHAHGVATGTEVGLYLQQRVASYPGSRQTPDFGTFDSDDRGEMVIPLLVRPPDSAGAADCAPRTVSLAIATLASPPSDHNLGTRSRRQRIAAAVAIVSTGFVSSFVYVSSLGIEQPVDQRVASADQAMITSNLATRDAAIDVEISSTRVPASIADAPIAIPPATPTPAEARKIRAPAIATAAVEAAGPASTKPRVKAPPNRRLKPAVDERNCPVTGRYKVTIDSYPPGATLYLNHKGCGELGRTPWDGTLPLSEGTATGTFLAILERPGEEPVMQEFKVLKKRRIQRLTVRMPPKQ